MTRATFARLDQLLTEATTVARLEQVTALILRERRDQDRDDLMASAGMLRQALVRRT